MADKPVILWFRRDLRLADNPALRAALDTGRPLLPVYILDDHDPGGPLGAALRWWLDKSLRALAADLRARGGGLILRRGDSEAELRRLIDQTGADRLFMNRLFEPQAFARDADIVHALEAEGVTCRGWNAAFLKRPGSVLNGSDQPYRVFTPFMKALLDGLETPPPCPAPATLPIAQGPASDTIDDWGLHPARPDWSRGFDWTPGEAGATAALGAFLAGPIRDYPQGRDFPGRAVVSRLSPHLHWGEISPWQAMQAAQRAAPAQAGKFISELAWREFSAHLLHHFPFLPQRAFRPEYDAMPWRDDPQGFGAWRRGLTGYPMVDAGMRQLWATGWMHNRVRMIAASFLTKHLLIDWRAGEAWFRDTLVDADLASNVQNWQWVAGCGADAAPYFRIFNPVIQGQKFDPDGAYVRRWIPEIAKLPDRWLHAPWTAPKEALAAAGVTLGTTYPRPIVDHALARSRALDAQRQLADAADES